MRPVPPDLTSFDALVLDLDGTLVDTLGDFVAALRGMLTDLGLADGDALTPDVVEPMVGKGSEHLIASVLHHVLDRRSGRAPQADPAIESLLPQAWALYQQHYQRINGQHARVYPGVAEALERWHRRGLPLACLTNKPLAFAEALLERKGLRPAFAQVFGGDSFARKKPDPQPLLGTCQALRSTPARTLMVGDSVNDAQAAQAAGCPVVLVRYGYNHGQPIDAVPARAHIDCLLELH